MDDVKKILSNIKLLIDKKITEILPKKGFPQVLFEGSWKYFEYGGKRFRPALIALSCEALGGKAEDTLDAGAALEIAHAFLLIHDDIEDFSETRRGHPTLHITYGMPQAINIGDYLMMISLDTVIVGSKTWGPEKTIKILSLFSDMFLRTAEGQATELDQRDKDLSEATIEWYKKMSLLKTGHYSGGIPCALGGLIADGTEEQIEALKTFGFAMGIAFQVQDDIINVTMSPEEEKTAPGTGSGGVGKDFAGDIMEGKRTLVLVHAFEKATEEEKKRLKELVGKRNITKEEKIEVIEIMKKYGSIDYAKNYAAEMMEEATENLRKNIPDNEGRSKLELVAKFLIERRY